MKILEAIVEKISVKILTITDEKEVQVRRI